MHLSMYTEVDAFIIYEHLYLCIYTCIHEREIGIEQERDIDVSMPLSVSQLYLSLNRCLALAPAPLSKSTNVFIYAYIRTSGSLTVESPNVREHLAYFPLVPIWSGRWLGGGAKVAYRVVCNDVCLITSM